MKFLHNLTRFDTSGLYKTLRLLAKRVLIFFIFLEKLMRPICIKSCWRSRWPFGCWSTWWQTKRGWLLLCWRWFVTVVGLNSRRRVLIVVVLLEKNHVINPYSIMLALLITSWIFGKIEYGLDRVKNLLVENGAVILEISAMMGFFCSSDGWSHTWNLIHFPISWTRLNLVWSWIGRWFCTNFALKSIVRDSKKIQIIEAEKKRDPSRWGYIKGNTSTWIKNLSLCHREIEPTFICGDILTLV